MTTYEPADWRPEPGDLAEVTWEGETARRVLTDTGAWWSRDGWVSNSAVEHVRRLLVVDPASTVVLDPESEADVDSVADAIRAHHKPSRLQVEVDWLAVQAALRSLLPAVTSPEPNGLGAVVVDADDEWVRTSGDKGAVAPWLSATEGEEERAWGHMRGPDVLSHGVGCACGAPDCNGGDQ